MGDPNEKSKLYFEAERLRNDLKEALQLIRVGVDEAADWGILDRQPFQNMLDFLEKHGQ